MPFLHSPVVPTCLTSSVHHRGCWYTSGCLGGQRPVEAVTLSYLWSPAPCIPSTWHKAGHLLTALLTFVAWVHESLSSPVSLVAQIVKNPPAPQQTQFWSLGREDPLEEKMAPYPSILAQRISWTEEPGRLQSMGSQGVGHDWVTNSFAFLCIFMLGEQGSETSVTCSESPGWWEGLLQGLGLWTHNGRNINKPWKDFRILRKDAEAEKKGHEITLTF